MMAEKVALPPVTDDSTGVPAAADVSPSTPISRTSVIRPIMKSPHALMDYKSKHYKMIRYCTTTTRYPRIFFNLLPVLLNKKFKFFK